MLQSFKFRNKPLTVEADDAVWHKKHQKYHETPANDLYHPPTMVQTVSRIFLILDSNHYNSQHSKK